MANDFVSYLWRNEIYEAWIISLCVTLFSNSCFLQTQEILRHVAS